MTEIADLRVQVSVLEIDINDIRKERNAFREDLSKSRARIAELQSLLDARESEIRDLRRQLKFSTTKVRAITEKVPKSESTPTNQIILVKGEEVDDDSDVEIIENPNQIKPNDKLLKCSNTKPSSSDKDMNASTSSSCDKDNSAKLLPNSVGTVSVSHFDTTDFKDIPTAASNVAIESQSSALPGHGQNNQRRTGMPVVKNPKPPTMTIVNDTVILRPARPGSSATVSRPVDKAILQINRSAPSSSAESPHAPSSRAEKTQADSQIKKEDGVDIVAQVVQPAAPPRIPTPITEPATDGNITLTSLPTSFVASHSNTSTNGDVRLIVAGQSSDQVRGADDPGQSLLTSSEQTGISTQGIPSKRPLDRFGDHGSSQEQRTKRAKIFSTNSDTPLNTLIISSTTSSDIVRDAAQLQAKIVEVSMNDSHLGISSVKYLPAATPNAVPDVAKSSRLQPETADASGNGSGLGTPSATTTSATPLDVVADTATSRLEAKLADVGSSSSINDSSVTSSDAATDAGTLVVSSLPETRGPDSENLRRTLLYQKVIEMTDKALQQPLSAKVNSSTQPTISPGTTPPASQDQSQQGPSAPKTAIRMKSSPSLDTQHVQAGTLQDVLPVKLAPQEQKGPSVIRTPSSDATSSIETQNAQVIKTAAGSNSPAKLSTVNSPSASSSPHKNLQPAAAPVMPWAGLIPTPAQVAPCSSTTVHFIRQETQVVQSRSSINVRDLQQGNSSLMRLPRISPAGASDQDTSAELRQLRKRKATPASDSQSWLAAKTFVIRHPLTIPLTRHQIRNWYGGSRFHDGQSKASRASAGRMFTFLSPDHPNSLFTPTAPGEPALYKSPFGNGHSNAALFIQVGMDPERWVYSGQYTRRLFTLSTEEIRSQNHEFKSVFANAVLAGGTTELEAMRRRIFLRRVVHPPEETWQSSSHNATDLTIDLTIDEVIESLECEDEELKIWGVKCIGYDQDFARNIKWMHRNVKGEMSKNLRYGRSEGANENIQLQKRRKRNIDCDDE